MLQGHRSSVKLTATAQTDPTASLVAVVGDEDVQREVERVKHQQAANDLIVLSKVSKVRNVRASATKRRSMLSFSRAPTAVQCLLNRVTFGIQEGTCY